ncbi:hypothetical protein E4U41_006874 [Claviceps citrina]|nr:hypothetical protein E4U41_006874 [Claviceps citrina]
MPGDHSAEEHTPLEFSSEFFDDQDNLFGLAPYYQYSESSLLAQPEQDSLDAQAPTQAASPLRTESSYYAWLESRPPPPEISSPYHFVEASVPATGRCQSPSLCASFSGLLSPQQPQGPEHNESALPSQSALQEDYDFLLGPERFSAAGPNLDHGLGLSAVETWETEPQQAESQQGDSHVSENLLTPANSAASGNPDTVNSTAAIENYPAPEPPRLPTSGAEPVPAAGRMTQTRARFRYTDEQLDASDEYAEAKFENPEAMEVGSAAYMSAIREAFPFYKTGITRQDRRLGYYTLNAEGLPVLHDRVFKADGVTRRRTVEQHQKSGDSCNAKRWYDDWAYKPASWGPNREFTYLEDAQLADRKYTTDEIKLYLDQCPRQYTLWVQREPPQSSHRREHRDGNEALEDKNCRWSCCPNDGRPVLGMYRVAFDEFADQTSQGIKDPYKVAMVMHLWCFEQILDPVVYYNRQVLRGDTRTFATPAPEEPVPDFDRKVVAEKKNNFSLQMGDDKKPTREPWPIVEVFDTWFRETAAAGTQTLPRVHKRSLGYRLCHWRKKNRPQCKKKQAMRRKQAAMKNQKARARAGGDQSNQAQEESESDSDSDPDPEIDSRSEPDSEPGAERDESDKYKSTIADEHLGSLTGYKKASDEKAQQACRERGPGTKRKAPPPQEPAPQEAGMSGRTVQVDGDIDVERSSKRRRIR